MIKIIIFFVLLLTIGCASQKTITNSSTKKDINYLVNKWHKDVASVNYDSYFDLMDTESIFIGTDNSENWTKEAFQKFAKPFFDRKKTWEFTSIERHIYFSKNHNIAWFDELLNTWMGICRGSGVLEFNDNKWKLKHYVLSVTVPNEEMKKVIPIKKEKDSLLIKRLNN
jgi:hypothetical protein